MPSFTATPSSPSRAVLKDHNRRHRPPKQPFSPSHDTSWVVHSKNGYHHRTQNSDDQSHQPKSPSMSRRRAGVLDRWAMQQAKNTITTIEVPPSPARSRDPSPSPSDSSVSSLVQKWREIETQLKNNLGPQDQSRSGHSSGACSVFLSRTNSFASSNDQENDSLSAPNCDQSASCDSHGGGSAENEKLRVVDIIKKLPLKEQGRVGTPEVRSPGKIRGWKTVANLLPKLKRDRYREIQATSERQAVSKFPERGFLQSMMKLKLLKLELPIQNHRRVHESSKSPKKKRAEAGEYGGDPVVEEEKASTSEQTNENHQKQTSCTNDEEKDQVENLGTAMATSESNNHREEEKEDIENAERWMTRAGDEAAKFRSWGADNTSSGNVWEVEEGDTIYEGEEEVYDFYDFYGPNLDWISDISRPRSYWESIRQAWYQKVFTSSSNTEIQQLIQRGSVSNVLASDFPDKMDQIMESSVRRKMQSFRSESEEDEQYEVANEEQIGNVDDVTEEPKQVVQVEDDSENCGGYYYKQYNEEEEEEEKSEEAESTPQQEHSCLTNSYDEEGSSSLKKNNSSIEAELIYDLRAQMEQMYREMSEMRRTINSCVEMQAKLQRCLNDNDEISGGKQESNNKVAKKGWCCICYENKVDSVLYRCGHMCACHKCGEELQWSSVKCPICRAQIADVVRVYTHE